MFFTLGYNFRLNSTQQSILIDIKLIEECRGGNLNNFRKLVELTSPFAFSVAFRMLGDEDQAKDIVQETMVTIWQKLKKIKSAEVYKTSLEEERETPNLWQMKKPGN